MDNSSELIYRIMIFNNFTSSFSIRLYFSGENMNHFMNDNWEEVMNQLGGPVIDAIGQVFKILLSNICELVPYNVVYPD